MDYFNDFELDTGLSQAPGIDEFGADMADFQAMSDDFASDDMASLIDEIEFSGIITPIQ